MKRTGLRKKSKSPAAKAKDTIQSLIREIVIERDGGCILRHYPIAGRCGPEKPDGTLILQAEHLNGRANSVSYAEPDNIVCLCMNHHIFFKKRNSGLYWSLVRKHIGERRWKKVDAWMHDRSSHRTSLSDWQRLIETLEKHIEHGKRKKAGT